MFLLVTSAAGATETNVAAFSPSNSMASRVALSAMTPALLIRAASASIGTKSCFFSNEGRRTRPTGKLGEIGN